MIYVITKGTYSDYHICAATTDKERAERLKILFSDTSNDAEIEEFEDGESGLEEERARKAYRIQIIKEKNKEKKIDSRAYTFIPMGNEPLENQIYFSGPDTLGTMYLVMYVLAEDQEHAEKIAADVWAQKIYEMMESYK